jgi:hypothetical protein
MGTNSRPPTAKIIPFPRKPSAPPGGAGRDTSPAVDHRQRPVPAVEFGSGWYHEAAIQEDGGRKP